MIERFKDNGDDEGQQEPLLRSSSPSAFFERHIVSMKPMLLTLQVLVAVHVN